MYTPGAKLCFSYINTEAFILVLKCATASYAPIYKSSNVLDVFFGIRPQIVPLKLSFAF